MAYFFFLGGGVRTYPEYIRFYGSKFLTNTTPPKKNPVYVTEIVNTIYFLGIQKKKVIVGLILPSPPYCKYATDYNRSGAVNLGTRVKSSTLGKFQWHLKKLSFTYQPSVYDTQLYKTS